MGCSIIVILLIRNFNNSHDLINSMTEINNEWIKKALAKRYGRNWQENMVRELIIRKISDQGTSETDV